MHFPVSTSLQTSYFAVGILYRCIRSLAKDLDPSNREACWEGPNTGIPTARIASLSPSTRGSSGPITTKSILYSNNQASKVFRFFQSRLTTVAIEVIPALPGAT